MLLSANLLSESVKINTMRYFLILSLFLVLTTLPQCKSNLSKLPERGICAHRGENLINPENTLSAFEAAVKLGAQMIEFDVRLTKDKVPVIMHDNSVDRTTNGNGPVSQLSFKQIRNLDAGSWKSEKFKGEKVPTLSEVLGVIPHNIWMNIHLKGDKELGQIVAETILKKGRIKQSVIACNSEVLKGVRAVDNGFIICNMERQGNRSEYVAETIKNKFPFIQLLIKRKDKTLADDIKRLNNNLVKINYYHAETAADTKELFNMGVNFVLTNNLSEMLSVAENLGIKRTIPAK